MKIKVFFGNQAKGLERAHGLVKITRKHLDFEGKIERLAQDSRIEKISGSIFGVAPRNYAIELNQSLTRKEILSLIKEYGFPKPISVSGNEDMGCTEHSLRTRVIFSPRPYQEIFFYQPYKIKE